MTSGMIKTFTADKEFERMFILWVLAQHPIDLLL